MSKVVFWDFDGTITYSTSLWSSSVLRALKDTDSESDIELEKIRKYMAFGFTWYTPNEDYSSLTGDKWWDFMNEHIFRSYLNLGVDIKTAGTATAKVRNIIKEKENYILYNDFVYTVTKLKKCGIRNVILSNNYPELKEVTDKLQITQYFDGIIVSALEGYDKPRKELFEIAKKTLSC
ncbi:MAG: HAD family hydrolase [Eubacterium sp.]